MADPQTSLIRVGTVQDDDADHRPPAPGLARLDDLFARVGSAGLPVDVVVTGARATLPGHLQLCVYRVVQESLTNVLKYAGLVPTMVALHQEPGLVTVRIADAGQCTGPVEPRPGNGLIGMRERARLYHGSLRAGVRPQGGFEVVLTLPTG